MVPNGWLETNIGSHLLNSKLRNKDGIFGHDDLRAVNKRHGMIPMKDRVKGKSVDRAKLVRKDWFAYNPMRINIGSICRWERETDCIVSPDYVVFHCNPQTLDTDYFDQFRRSHKWNKFMEDAGRGSVRIRIYLETLKQLKCTLPPIDEQKTIAAILKTWDQAIQVTQSLIENSERQKKALMQQLLTGKKRLKGFSGEWYKATLEDLAKVTMGSSPKSSAYNENGDGLPLIQGNADIKNGLSSPRSFTSEITKTCKIDDTLISVRAPVGDVSRAVHEACIGRGIASVRSKHTSSQEFIHQYLEFCEPHWARYAQGSTFEAINQKDVRKLVLVAPPKQEQVAIAQILKTAAADLEKMKQKKQILLSEKAALMQQLLTGKRRVKIDEGIAA